MKKKPSLLKTNMFDGIILLSIISILVFSSVSVSSGYFRNEAQSVEILRTDADLTDKELLRSFSLLADDVCDDCDDDDDVDPSKNEKPTAIIYEVIPNPGHEFQSVSFLGYGEDDDGEITGYRWESSIDGIINDGSSFNTTMLSSGVHTIYFSVQDNLGAWSEPANISLEIIENQPPSIPIIGGQDQGKAGEPAEYEFISTDPNENQVYYFVEWGDGTVEEWVGPIDSDDPISLTHTWDERGSYSLRAKAKDEFDEESDWASMEIAMPYVKNKNFDLLDFIKFKLIENNLVIRELLNQIFK